MQISFMHPYLKARQKKVEETMQHVFPTKDPPPKMHSRVVLSSPSHIHLMLPDLRVRSYCTSQLLNWSSRRVSSEQSHSLIAMQ